MQHFLTFYLVLSVLPGIAAVTVLMALAFRFRQRALTYYLIAYSCFTVSILVNLVMFYLGINISTEISAGVFALIFFGFPFSVLMHTMLPLAANEVVQPPGKRLIDIFIIIVAVIELGLFSTPLLMHYSRETHAIIFGPIFPFVGAIQIMFIGYSIGIVFFRRAFIKNGQVRKYILMIIAVIVIFFPAIAYDQFYFSGVASIDKVPIAIILSPLFYMALSLVTLVFGVKILISSVRATGKVTLQTEDLAKLAKEFGLTEREKNIIPLMVSGYGNKQIALELNLSVKTVGNHIYNMYRKLGISSRYELLALLT